MRRVIFFPVWAILTFVGFASFPFPTLAQTEDAQQLKAGESTVITELTKLDVKLKKSNLTSVKPVRNGKVAQNQNLLKIGDQVAFDPAANKLKIAKPGTYELEFNYKDKSGKPALDRFFVKVLPAAAAPPGATTGAGAGADSDGGTDVDTTEETDVAPVGALSGDLADIDALHTKFSDIDTRKEFKDHVIQLANAWGTVAGKKGAVNGVASFDTTPADTCSKIAKILRDVEAELKADPSRFAGIHDSMKARFQTFYAAGDNRFYLTNPYEEDWRPFLQRLLADADAKIAEHGKSKDVPFHRLVLLEVAGGFDQLRDQFMGVSAGGGAPGIQNGSGMAGGSTADECDRCRRRRRCRCSSLLFR